MLTVSRASAEFAQIHKEKSEMVTKIGKTKLVWGLYGVLAVGIFLSAVSVEPARAYDTCTQAECTAAYNAAYADCEARGGYIYTFTCPLPSPYNDSYSYSCVINGTEWSGFGGQCS